MKTVLIAVDCQKFFQAELQKSLPNILKLIKAFAASTSPSRSTVTVFTQHGHTKDELSGKVPNQLIRRWKPSGSIAYGSTPWEFLPDTQALKTDDVHLCPKNSYDAFVNTGLEEWLRKAGVERVAVCGCLSDFCCETTAKSAFCRGFETWYVEDACGTTSKDMHELGVNAFKKTCAETLTTEQVLGWLEGGEEPRIYPE
ncbi:hypothetical protein MMC10_001594 [Thelotrema lepadinum]|nr:hypothetical protein [Thelotrema lepadinum]